MSKRIRIILILLTLSVTLSFMSHTYSRYVVDTTGNVELSFARWQILVNDTDITEGTTNNIEITPVVEKNDNVKENTLAPSSKGYFDILIPKDKLKGAVPGHKVLIMPVREGHEYIGEILRIIGHKNDVGVDILSYVYQYDFDPVYSDDVMDCVLRIPTEVSLSDMEGRTDLRDEIIFTIDGDDTKDIDDAISIKKLSDDMYELGVHIADVSHYVVKDGVIDKDAYDRGTSVYLVDRVIPMLPHKLSNGICSLNPNVDRLALSCVMNINVKGHVTGYKIFKSVIRSKKQMTYNCVNEILENIWRDRYRKRMT